MRTERVKVTFYPREREYDWAIKEAMKYNVPFSTYVCSLLTEKYNQRKEEKFDPRKVLPELSRGEAK